MTIGSSSVPTIVGVNPWGSEAEVWARAVGIDTGSISTPATRRGNGTEWACAQWFMMEKGFIGQKGPTFEQDPFVNPKLPWLHARPDVLVWEAPFTALAHQVPFDSVAEIKTSRYLDREIEAGGRLHPGWGPEGSGLFPRWVAVQLVVHLAVTERDHGYVVAWGTVDDDFRIYRVERNLRAERGILDTAERWYERHVVQGKPPGADGKERTSRVIDRAIEALPAKRLTLTTEMSARVEKLRSLRAKRREIEAMEEMISQEVKLWMADAEELLDARGRRVATWKGSPVRRWRWATTEEEDDG